LQRLWAEVEDKNKKLAQLTKERDTLSNEMEKQIQVSPFSIFIYRICSRNLRTFFSVLTAEKLECVNYADFFFFFS
jgi:hypothetical protein